MLRSAVSVAAVVVNYGSHAMLDAPHFHRLADHPHVDVIVVDSFHSDVERTRVREVCNRLGFELLGLADNPGFGGAVNQGVAHALQAGPRGALVLVNPDAVVDPDVLDRLARRVVDDPDLVVCPTIEDRQGRVWFGGGALLVGQGFLRTQRIDVRSVDHPWVTGACLAISPGMWGRLGGLDERYFMYWEDIDLSYRARRLGATLAVDPDLRVTHLVGATQAAEGKSDLYRRYNCRNRLLFAGSHLSDAQMRSWVRHTPSYTRTILLRGGRRALLRRPVSMTWSVVRGTAEGLLAMRAARRARR